MAKFYEQRRRKIKTKGATLYQHLISTQDSLRQEEWQAYQRLILAFVIVMSFAVLIYFLGIPTVNFISSFWLKSNDQNPALNQNSTLIFPPRLDSLPSAINDLSQFKVAGWAPAGAEVQIFVNGNEVKRVLTDASGRFEVTGLSLNEDTNAIYALTMVNDEKSQPSNKQIVRFDKTKPELIINQPSENIKITKEEDKWLTVAGITEEKAQVFINEHQAIVDLEGNFKYQYPLQIGENKLKMIVRDEAGNESVVERLVIFEPPTSHSPSLSPSFPS